uniref:WH2 domain-containing protein n=1 Tax=Trichuris muris TaxID=70415 RepID=A0A5S6QXS5_TRIMR
MEVTLVVFSIDLQVHVVTAKVRGTILRAAFQTWTLNFCLRFFWPIVISRVQRGCFDLNITFQHPFGGITVVLPLIDCSNWPDDSFRALGEPQLGFGRLVRELLCHLGISTATVTALVRVVLNSWIGLRWISTVAITLQSEVNRSRSFVRAMGNTFRFPVGNVFVDVQEHSSAVRAARYSVDSSGSDLWENADTCESETVCSGSEADRIAKLEFEVQALRELLTNYKNECFGMSKDAGSLPNVVLADAQVTGCSNEKKERCSLKDDKVKAPVPEAPPLPSGLLPRRATVPAFADSRKNNEHPAVNGILSTSEPPCDSHAAPPSLSDVLRELPNVRLKPVQKSPGGTPLFRRKQKEADLANFFQSLLARRFANVNAENEDPSSSSNGTDDDEEDSQAESDIHWKV